MPRRTAGSTAIDQPADAPAPRSRHNVRVIRILRAFHRDELMVGLVLLGIVAFSVSAYVAMANPPLSGPDERSHAAYAIALMAGDLPTIDTPVIDDPARFPQVSASLEGRDPDRSDVWTANHPPLYYLISVPLLAAADWLDQPGAGLLAMRLLNALGMAISVVLVGMVARELVPGRPAVALLATTLAAASGTALAIGGSIFNDGLGIAASTLTLFAGVRLLTAGPTRGRIALAALAGAAAVGLRAPGMISVVLCAAAALYAVWRSQRDGPAARRWLRAAGAGAVVAGVPAVAFGWFYARNLLLYGDVGATAALLEKFDRQPRGLVLADVATDPELYFFQFRALFMQGVTLRAMDLPWLRYTPRVLLLVVLVGLMTAVLAWWIHSQRGRRLPPRGLVLAWVMMAAHAALIEYSIMSFYIQGGNRHIRYILPVLPLLMTVVAVGLLGLLAGIRADARPRWELIATGVWSAVLLGSMFVLQVVTVEAVSVDRGPLLSGPSTSATGYGSALAVGVAAALGFLVWLVWWATRAPIRPVTEDGHEPEPTGSIDVDQAVSV
jgi:hypothetical protein